MRMFRGGRGGRRSRGDGYAVMQHIARMKWERGQIEEMWCNKMLYPTASKGVDKGERHVSRPHSTTPCV
jgi:hypothetical protein